MNYVNRIIGDLREKRLWPVALVLAVALVAVPVLLSSSAPPTHAAALAPVGAPAPPSTALPAVTVAPGSASARLAGRARDPFIQQPLPAVGTGSGASPSIVGSTGASATGSGSTAGAGGAASGTGTGSSGGSESTPSGTSTTSTAPTGVTYRFFSVDLSFGKPGHRARQYRDVPRLAPFPSPSNPVLVFLGVKNDTKTVVFLITSTATPSGPGKCVPARGQCELLSLKIGQAERLTVLNWNGTTTNYALKVSAVHLIPTSSSAQANAAYARVSPAGQEIFNQAVSQSPLLGSVVYSPDSGVLSVNSLSLASVAHLGRWSLSPTTGVLLEPTNVR